MWVLATPVILDHLGRKIVAAPERQCRHHKGGSSMTKFLLAAGAAVLLAAPAVAAETQADAPVRAVSARGVDFSDAAQVKQFYSRLHVAAQAVCDAGSPVPRAFAVDQGCLRQVVSDAVKAANQPVLTALYNSTGDSNHAFAGNEQ
jgi:UrcA family protein